jgi:hypothetical protein
MADEGRHRRPVDARDHPTDPCNRRVGEVAPPLARIMPACASRRRHLRERDRPQSAFRLASAVAASAPSAAHRTATGSNVSPFSTSWTPAQQRVSILHELDSGPAISGHSKHELDIHSSDPASRHTSAKGWRRRISHDVVAGSSWRGRE